jgi:hypothetical protein
MVKGKIKQHFCSNYYYATMFHIARLNFTLLLCVHKGKFAAIVLSCFFPMLRKMGVGFVIVGYSLLGENKILLLLFY